MTGTVGRPMVPCYSSTLHIQFNSIQSCESIIITRPTRNLEHPTSNPIPLNVVHQCVALHPVIHPAILLLKSQPSNDPQ